MNLNFWPKMYYSGGGGGGSGGGGGGRGHEAGAQGQVARLLPALRGGRPLTECIRDWVLLGTSRV